MPQFFETLMGQKFFSQVDGALRDIHRIADVLERIAVCWEEEHERARKEDNPFIIKEMKDASKP